LPFVRDVISVFDHWILPYTPGAHLPASRVAWTPLSTAIASPIPGSVRFGNTESQLAPLTPSCPRSSVISLSSCTILFFTPSPFVSSRCLFITDIHSLSNINTGKRCWTTLYFMLCFLVLVFLVIGGWGWSIGFWFPLFFRFPVSKIDGASGGNGLWAVVDRVDQVPTWRLCSGEKGLMLVLDRMEGGIRRRGALRSVDRAVCFLPPFPV